MKKISQSGRSMMEMLGVLAVVGVLSVGGFAMVSKMQASYEANKVMDEIADLANRVRVVFRDYEATGNGASMNKYLRKTKAYPDSFNENESDIIDDTEFLGVTGIGYKVLYTCLGTFDTTKGCQGSQYYMIVLTNMTEDLCNQVVTSNWGSPSTNGFIGIGTGDAITSTCDCSSPSPSCARANSKACPVPMGIGAAVTFCEEHHSDFNLIYK